MKICFVSREVAGLRGGGIGTYVAEAGKALTAHGHEVWLVTEAPRRGETLGTLPGFHRAVATGTGVPAQDRTRMINGGRTYEYAYAVHQTLQALKIEGHTFDYIEFADYDAEGYVVLLEQHLFRTYDPAVIAVTIHSPLWECLEWDRQTHRMGLRERNICNLEESALRMAPNLNGPSRHYSGEVCKRLGLPQPVEIIRYPMELSAEAPTPPEPRERLEDLRFLYFGRIEPRKGIDELVDAFAQLPELSIDLVGADENHSPFGESYRRWVQRRATPNVRFLDPIPRPELLARLSETDVCVLPSLLENYPNTCIESMSAGRVVLGSIHGGMSEMIEHGVSGFLLDGRSPDSIVRCIREDLGAALPKLNQIGAAAASRMRELSDPSAYVGAIERRIEAARTASPSVAVEPATPTTPPLVTVVIPFYEDREWIDASVDSALAQSHANTRVLIVNDGSPLEDAETILARQSAKDARVRVVSKANGGLGSARNHGIEHAEGDYLLFLDADNVLHEDYAETAVRLLQADPEAMFVAPHMVVLDHPSNKIWGHYNPLPFDRTTALLANQFGDAGACFRRSVFLDHELRYDELRLSYEDLALWYDLDHRGLRGILVPRALYTYRRRQDSMLAVDGRPRYPAIMGLLIDRHFHQVDPEARRILSTLFQVAGKTVLGVPLRHKLVDRLAEMSRKIPGLNTVLRSLLVLASRIAGKR